MKIHSNPYIYNVKCIYCSKTVQSSFSPGMKKKKKPQTGTAVSSQRCQQAKVGTDGSIFS